MGLQTDADGNFYYAKAARHGKTALVPQHGTLLRVSRDGLRTDILATGFRAPNGVCLNDDGTFFLTDQEGFWTPKNRINHVKVGRLLRQHVGLPRRDRPVRRGHGAPRLLDHQRLRPLAGRAGPRHERRLGTAQGLAAEPLLRQRQDLRRPARDGRRRRCKAGCARLPIPPLPTGVMRGRFHPKDGQLYACGMFAWAGNQTAPGGFYRIRATGKPMFLPTGLHATKNGLKITFTEPIDRASASDRSHYSVKTWSLKRTANYGSEHYDEKTASTSPRRRCPTTAARSP